jgi:hypothetical protein
MHTHSVLLYSTVLPFVVLSKNGAVREVALMKLILPG